MPKITKIDLTNPVVFDAVFTKPFFAADFLNSIGNFKVDEKNVKIEKTKYSEGVMVKYVDMDVVLRILNESSLFENKTEFVSFEQQKRKPKYDMSGRLVTYLGKLINKSEPVGPGYQNNKCTVIAILSFNLFDDERFLRTFKLKDEEGNIIEYASIIVIELTKQKFCNTIDLKKWIDIFTNLNLEEDNERESDMMKKVKEEIRKLSDDPLFQMKLDLYEEHEKERQWELELAKQEAISEGRAEGLAEGLAEGRAAGLAEGKAEGKEAGINEEKISIAKKMKQMEMDFEIISKLTELSIDIILNL